MYRRRPRKPAVTVATADLELHLDFFVAIGWEIRDRAETSAVLRTSGGIFGLEAVPGRPPRLELALSLPDPLDVDAVAEVVDTTGGITMEPLQETVWGGWGFSFNDPLGNTWELGAPWTVTAVDRWLSTGARPMRDGPIIVLSVPWNRLPQTA